MQKTFWSPESWEAKAAKGTNAEPSVSSEPRTAHHLPAPRAGPTDSVGFGLDRRCRPHISAGACGTKPAATSESARVAQPGCKTISFWFVPETDSGCKSVAMVLEGCFYRPRCEKYSARVFARDFNGVLSFLAVRRVKALPESLQAQGSVSEL